MANRVLLVFAGNADRRLSIDCLPPMGVLMLAAQLEKQGIACDVLDGSVAPLPNIDSSRYDLVGFSVNLSNLAASLRAIDRIGRLDPKKEIVVGGSLCLCAPDLFFGNPYIAAIFACEGEYALPEYLQAGDKRQVKGLYVRSGDGFEYTGERPWIDDLDALPFAALHKVDITKYNVFPKKARPVSSLMSSRGCPFGCIFCSHSMGRKWRPRSAEHVVEELRWQVRTFGVREICIFDDNFSMDRQRANAICEQLLRSDTKVRLQFTNGLRVDCLDADLLAALQRAGTWLIGIAPESGSPSVLKQIRKGFDHDQVLTVRAACRRLGIKNFGFFMIGFPFETRNDIEQTVRFARRLDCEIVEFNKVVPYPRTELYDRLAKSGALKQSPFDSTLSYHEGDIATHEVGDLSPGEVRDLIRGAYRQYYLRPGKMLDLIRTFSWRDLATLTTYALKTGNV